MREKLSLVVVSLLLIAGCSGGPTVGGALSETQSTTSPATEQPTIDEREPVPVATDGASLGDVNATAVWYRVDDIVAVDRPSPPEVVVKPLSEDPRDYQAGEFYSSLGATNADFVSTGNTVRGRYSYATYQVTLWRAPNASSARIEAVLAHEFAHAYQENAKQEYSDESNPLTQEAIKEGSAELVEWRYAERYLEGFDAETELATDFEEMWAIQRIGWAYYLYGARYARNYSDSGAPMASMYADQPTTSEQVLHGLPPGSEPPRPLSVRGNSTDAWSWDGTSVRRFGEIPIRYALEIGVSRDQAALAAEGWGNDRWMRFVSSEGYAYAWVLRWDTASDAREFERAFTAYRANVSEPLALHSVGNETTVLVSGPDSFVQNATVSGTQRNVTVAA